jgi:hypothetical protein
LIHDANQIKHCNRSVDFKHESWLADICLSLLIEKTIVLNNWMLQDIAFDNLEQKLAENWVVVRWNFFVNYQLDNRWQNFFVIGVCLVDKLVVF